MTTPDVNALIGEVAARHGIALHPDDPAFALVTVNQLVLEQTMAELVEHTQRMAREFDQAGVRLHARAGSVLAAEVRKAGLEIRQALCEDIASAGLRARQSMEDAQRTESRSIMYRWLAAGLVAALALFVLGVLVGRMWQ